MFQNDSALWCHFVSQERSRASVHFCVLNSFTVLSEFLLLNVTKYVFLSQAMDEFTIGTFQTDEAEVQETDDDDDDDYTKTFEDITSQHQDWEDGVIN